MSWKPGGGGPPPARTSTAATGWTPARSPAGSWPLPRPRRASRDRRPQTSRARPLLWCRVLPKSPLPYIQYGRARRTVGPPALAKRDPTSSRPALRQRRNKPCLLPCPAIASWPRRLPSHGLHPFARQTHTRLVASVVYRALQRLVTPGAPTGAEHWRETRPRAPQKLRSPLRLQQRPWPCALCRDSGPPDRQGLSHGPLPWGGGRVAC